MRRFIPATLAFSTLAIFGLYWAEHQRVKSLNSELLTISQEVGALRTELRNTKKLSVESERINAAQKKKMSEVSVNDAPIHNPKQKTHSRSIGADTPDGPITDIDEEKTISYFDPMCRKMMLNSEEKESIQRNEKFRSQIHEKYFERLLTEKDADRRQVLIEEREVEMAAADQDIKIMLGSEKYATFQDYRSKKSIYDSLDIANALLQSKQKQSFDDDQLDHLAEFMHNAIKNSPISNQLSEITKGALPSADEINSLFAGIEEMHSQINTYVQENKDVDADQAEAVKSSLELQRNMVKMLTTMAPLIPAKPSQPQ
jgi:hypothetical protein